MAELERQLGQYKAYQQKAYDGLVRGMTDEETYHRVVAGYQAHQTWLGEELERQHRDLERVEQQVLSTKLVQELYPALRERLSATTEEDKRFVLEFLQSRVIVEPSGITLELAIPQELHRAVNARPGFFALS